MKVLGGRLPSHILSFFRKIELYLYIINVNKKKAFHPNAETYSGSFCMPLKMLC